MKKRHIVHAEDFRVSCEALFQILHTPSAICQWWSASSAIVIPKTGGVWAATWGDDKDDPDYVSSATMSVFDPPKRLVMQDYQYHTKSGGLPFEAEFVTEFAIESTATGAKLTVTQDGFPPGEEADDFYAGCQKGWRDTFAGIRGFLEKED